MDVLDMIITDTGLSSEWAEIIRGKGIELVMV
ncbi:MAG: DeoR/GlpR transcriptional regulator, partial [Clostridium sp.]|nr:DeoR/GlpR transcriptional regulator [Clostridium sp.]